MGVISCERLLFLYFYCGCIGHTLKHRNAAPTDLSEEQKENSGNRTWLKAELENSVLASAFSMSVDMHWAQGTAKRYDQVEIARIQLANSEKRGCGDVGVNLGWLCSWRVHN